jgi:ABC-2 type transport system ATP-binding protein
MQQVEEMADRLLMINRGEQKLYGPVDEVRAQYALPAVRVEGEGNWSLLPGVERVELSENGKKTALLYLGSSVTPDSVLAEIATRPDMHLRSFELAIPSLEDIFVQVVTGDRKPA